MQIQPYLTFEGRCEEAVEFYRNALGAEVRMLMRMKDNPVPPAQGDSHAPAGANAEKILHTELDIGGTTVMCSDGMMQEQASFKGFALSITVPDETAAQKAYALLADGGQRSCRWPRPSGRLVSACSTTVGVCWMVGMNPQ